MIEDIKSLDTRTLGNCFICGRPLSNSESLESGIGPICSRKYQYLLDQVTDPLDEEKFIDACKRANIEVNLDKGLNKASNQILRYLTRGMSDSKATAAVDALAALGYYHLAAVVGSALNVSEWNGASKEKAYVRFDKSNKRITIKNGKIVREFWNEFLNQMKSIPGRRWSSHEKINYFPLWPQSAKIIINLCKRWFPFAEIDDEVKELAKQPDIEVKLPKKVTKAKIEFTEEGIDIYTPKFNSSFNESLKSAVFGWNKFWDKKKRCWTVKKNYIEAAIDVVIEYYPTAEFDNNLSELVEKVKKQNTLATAITTNEEITLHGGKLYQFQSAGVHFLELKVSDFGGVIIGDDMGCIDGNAMIKINRAGKTSTIKLKDLYKRFNGIEGKWNKNISTYTKSFTGEELNLNRIKKVLYQGKKDVIEIETKSGKKLILTDDHKLFRKDDKEIEAKHSLNKKILINGKPICKRCGEISFLPKEDRVINIKKIGKRKVYDIVMKDPYRNFIANGIVVHNCGKTVQALAFIDRDVKRQPTLVVCPANVKLNWGAKVMEWINNDINCVVIEGNFFYNIDSDGRKNRKKNAISELPYKNYNVVIVNYDMLKKHKDIFDLCRFETIVFDESHYLKEYKSGRSKAAREIAKNIPRRILMTGTPVLNRPRELWHQLHICNPQKWPKFTTFAYKYCGPETNRWGTTFNGATNLDELHRRVIGQYMIRRRKKEVLKDLPNKSVFRTILDIEKVDRKEYDLAVQDFKEWAKSVGGVKKLLKVMRAEAISRLTTLKRLCAISKVNAFTEHCLNWLESNEEQLTVFAHHQDVINALEHTFKKNGYNVVTIRGGDNSNDRQKAIDNFKLGKARIFLASIMAAGIGTDGLQVCQNMKIIERTWRPADMEQLHDRLYRIGQKNHVMIEYIDMDNSIDDKMYVMIKKKMKIINQIVDGSAADAGDISEEVMQSILENGDDNETD